MAGPILSWEGPIATYRLQFNKGFTFNDARALAPYLRRLGISHIYASPIFKARPGSSHGYDVTDPTTLNPELGTDQEFDALVQELHANGVGLLVDIVPNHMAASPHNSWWADLLESGPASPYAGFFDVDWLAVGSGADQKIVLPILGQPYHEVLEEGELALSLDDAGFNVRYHDHRLPLEAKSYRTLLSYQAEALRNSLGSDHSDLQQLQELIGLTDGLPHYYETSRDDVWRRDQLVQRLKQGVLGLSRASPEIGSYLQENLEHFKGKPGDPQSFNLLHQLLCQQPYRLTFWMTGREMLNYRRFFDVTGLAGVRVEDPAVFEATHGLALKLAKEGKINGLRLDHIDGLYDPTAYLHRLQEHLVTDDGPESPFYVVVEKILSHDETLPPDWPVAGTTGYESLNVLNGVFVDRDGFERLMESYHRLTGATKSFLDVVYEQKRKAIQDLFSVEVRNLGNSLARLAQQDRYASDLPRQELTRALVEVTACLPTYRTYSRDGEVSQRDRRYVERAVREASRRCPDLNERAMGFLSRVLLGQWLKCLTTEQRDHWRRFVSQWQQFSGPAMAKGLEDTSLYIYHPLVSLNEVGGTPTGERLSVENFHQHNAFQRKSWPHSMNTTSTHDTKRSEDVRARLNILSEIPKEWERCLQRWMRWNRTKKREVSGQLLPEPNTEILLYQSLVGAWPLSHDEVAQFKDRLKQYLIKAAREAKTYTSWLAPDLAYEDCLLGFAEAILTDSPDNRFLDDFLKFQSRVAYFGALNSLSQTLLKIASPGVPDFYQGTELWDFSLVDPDNRRPVDFPKRADLLDKIAKTNWASAATCRTLLSSWDDGRIKLYVICKALELRRESRDLFAAGEYLPLQAEGERKEHISAFARRLGDAWVVVVVPRFLTRLVTRGRGPLGRKVWGETALVLPVGAPQDWYNVLTGETIQTTPGTLHLPLSTVFSSFPGALLTEPAGGGR